MSSTAKTTAIAPSWARANRRVSRNAARRIITTLFISQSLVSAALIANATVNPIVAAALSGRDYLAGLPGMLLLIGAAGAAPTAGRAMERIGRRLGLAAGFFVGMAPLPASDELAADARWCCCC